MSWSCVILIVWCRTFVRALWRRWILYVDINPSANRLDVSPRLVLHGTRDRALASGLIYDDPPTNWDRRVAGRKSRCCAYNYTAILRCLLSMTDCAIFVFGRSRSRQIHRGWSPGRCRVRAPGCPGRCCVRPPGSPGRCCVRAPGSLGRWSPVAVVSDSGKSGSLLCPCSGEVRAATLSLLCCPERYSLTPPLVAVRSVLEDSLEDHGSNSADVPL